MQNILKVFLEILSRLFNRKEIIIIEAEIKPMETNAEKLLKVALDALDTDPTPKDEVSDDVSCAHTLSTLIHKVFVDFPIVESTHYLDLKLFMDKRFERTDTPGRGKLIISPRTTSTFGHCGLWITNDRIASNDSRTGLFQCNYSYDSWILEFIKKRGLHIYIYEIKG